MTKPELPDFAGQSLDECQRLAAAYCVEVQRWLEADPPLLVVRIGVSREEAALPEDALLHLVDAKFAIAKRQMLTRLTEERDDE